MVKHTSNFLSQKNTILTRFLTLLWALTYRNITSRYRKSFLGPLWAVLQPLTYMVIFVFLKNFSNFSSGNIPYPVFTLTALVPWTFFTNAILQAGPSILLNAPIIKKISIPREVFPLSAVTTAAFDFIISTILLFLLILLYKIDIGLYLLWFPILFLQTSVLAFSFGMFFAALGTFKKDLVLLAPILTQFGLFISPIMYPLKQVPEKYLSLYMLNPFVGIIESFRNIVLHSAPPPLLPFCYSIFSTLVLLIVFWPLYKIISQYFADTI